MSQSRKEQSLFDNNAITSVEEQNTRKNIGTYGFVITNIAFFLVNLKSDLIVLRPEQVPDTLWIFLFGAFAGVYLTGILKLWGCVMADQWKPDGHTSYEAIPSKFIDGSKNFLAEKKKEFILQLVAGAVFAVSYFWILMKFLVQRTSPAPEENLCFAGAVLAGFSVLVVVGSSYHPAPKNKK